MGTIVDGISVYFKTGGTNLDIYSTGKNAVQGEYLNAMLDAAKVVHTYVELIVKEYPSLGLGINVAKLGKALDDLATKQNAGKQIVLNDVAAPLLAVTDIVTDLALASPSPQIKVAALLGKGATLVANTALVAFGERVVIPQREPGKDYGIEVHNNATGETATVTKVGVQPTTTAIYQSAANAVPNEYSFETFNLAGSRDAGMYTATAVTNAKSGEIQYIIRHNGTGEAIASGSNYVVNANNTISTSAGTATFTHSLTDGRLRVMQNADGSGLVVGKEGNDIYFGAGSVVTPQADGSVKVQEPVAGGGRNDYTVRYGVVVEKVSDTNGDGKAEQTTTTKFLGNGATEQQQDTNGDGKADRVTVTQPIGANASRQDEYDVSGQPETNTQTAPVQSSTVTVQGQTEQSASWDGQAQTNTKVYDTKTVPGQIAAEAALVPMASGDSGTATSLLTTVSSALTAQLVNVGEASTTVTVTPGSDTDPIGAFYESASADYAPAPSIAHATPRVFDAQWNALSALALAARDSNADGRLSGAELSGLQYWRDANENGAMDAAETGSAGPAEILSRDYGFYTQGNAKAGNGAAGLGAALDVGARAGSVPQLVQASNNYRWLRDNENIYVWGSIWDTLYSLSWNASQVKFSPLHPTMIIGTDGNDAFSAAGTSIYQGYPYNFDTSRIVQYMAGAGDDQVGGSSRADTIWGGEGNDSLWGYEGQDELYGDAGNDTYVVNSVNDVRDVGQGQKVANDAFWRQVA